MNPPAPAARLSAGFLAFAVLLLPLAASAQSVITGVVRDATGGVLPGVTVEGTSPALIEKGRTVARDATNRLVEKAIANQRCAAGDQFISTTN